MTEKWLAVEFMLMILTPVICLFGIVTNSLVVRVVSAKSSQKELENNHYKFMRLNALVNMAILFIEPLSLITECQGFMIGFVCSSARFALFSQYLKIIVVEYVSNVLRLLSNFSYVGFAINRLSLVGKEHGKFVTGVSALSVSQFVGRTIVPCVGLAVVKIFHSYPNSFDPTYEYPFTSNSFYSRISDTLLYVYLSFEFLFNLVNYFVFLGVNFVLDIVLAINMKRTLNEKAKKKLTMAVQQKSEKK